MSTAPQCDPSNAAIDELIGLVLGSGYRVLARIGIGGMGVVYRVWDHTLGRYAVAKVPRRSFVTDHVMLARFDRDASRLLAFAEFFRTHPQHAVPDFWQWDKSRNSPGKTSASPASGSWFVPNSPSAATETSEGTPTLRPGTP